MNSAGTAPDSRLRSAVAAYFVVSAGLNLLMVIAFGDLYRRYFTLRYQQAPAGATLADSVDGAMAVLLALTVAMAVLSLIVAVLTLARPRPWVLLVDAVTLLAVGGPTVVGRAIEVFSPTHAALPPVFGQTQLVLSTVAVLLAIAILVSRRTRRPAALTGAG